MYNVGTKVTIEAREEHTLCDGNTAIIWEVKVYEFKDLAELSFRITEGNEDCDHYPLGWCTNRNSLFEARKYIKESDAEKKEAMSNEN